MKLVINFRYLRVTMELVTSCTTQTRCFHVTVLHGRWVPTKMK